MLTKRISAIAKRVSSGLTPLRRNPEFWENGTMPWLKTEQLGEKFIYATTEKISDIALAKTSIRTCPPDTLSVAMYGEGKTRGNVSIIKTAMTTNQACCNIEIDPKIADFEYVYYFLKTQYNELRNQSSGVRKNLNSDDIRNFSVRLPEKIEEQKKIAAVLSCIDAKIDLNNRINAELEALAKMIYDYWFVQFDFPDANGRPYKSSGGAMVWNDTLKREIPAGWEDKLLAELGIFRNGINYDPSVGGSSSARIVNVRNVSASSVFVKHDDLDSLPLAQTEIDKYLVTPESILIARSGIPGATRMMSPCPPNTIYCGFIICFTVSDQKNKLAVFFKLKQLEAALLSNSSGSILKNVSQDTLKAIRMAMPSSPSDPVITRFNCAIESLHQKMNLNDQENAELTQLRDWLLPLLMNGQVRVA